MTLSQRLRQIADVLDDPSKPALSWQAAPELRFTADRLDALAALRPMLAVHAANCEHCQTDSTLDDLLALLPEGGQ